MTDKDAKAGRPPRANKGAVVPSSGNVFADLELEGADELAAKADLARDPRA